MPAAPSSRWRKKIGMRLGGEEVALLDPLEGHAVECDQGMEGLDRARVVGEDEPSEHAVGGRAR